MLGILKKFFKKYPGLKSPLGLLIPLILLIIIISLINPVFLSGRNIFNILRQISIYLIVCAGMTLVIGNRGIDLSVASIVALASNATGLLLYSAVPIPLVIIVSIMVGILAGAFNGIVISYFKIPPFITTISTLIIFRGINYLVMKDRVLRVSPDFFKFIGQGSIYKMPVIFIIALAILLILGVFLNNTRTGKYIIAVGGNEVTAKRTGIKIQRHQLLSYIICGTTCGIAGILLASRLGTTQAIVAVGLELHVIAVVILGGTYLFGGFATMLGTFIGGLLLGVIENGLVLTRVPFYYQQITVGLILIITVGIQIYRYRKSLKLG